MLESNDFNVPEAVFLGFAYKGSSFSSLDLFSLSKFSKGKNISPLISKSLGKSPLSFKGIVLIVFTLVDTFSPFVPSPLVTA